MFDRILTTQAPDRMQQGDAVSVPDYVIPPIVDNKFVEIKTTTIQIKIVGGLTKEVEGLIYQVLSKPTLPIFKLPKTLRYILMGIAGILIYSLISRLLFR